MFTKFKCPNCQKRYKLFLRRKTTDEVKTELTLEAIRESQSEVADVDQMELGHENLVSRITCPLPEQGDESGG